MMTHIHDGMGWQRGPNSLLFLRKNADINAALTMGEECLQEDGAIFIGANIEGRGSINEPNSDVGNATLDHRDNYIHLVDVDTW